MKKNKLFRTLTIGFISSAMFFAADCFAQSGGKNKTNTNKSNTTNNTNTNTGTTTGQSLVCIPISEWNSMYDNTGNSGGTNNNNSGSN